MTAAQLKLGRVPSPPDHRDLLIENYLTALPTPPTSVDYSKPVPKWGELGNDVCGDCTEAGAGHHVQCWTANAQGKEASITTSVILKRYERLSGYVPGDESTDTGLDERTVLKDWLKNPIGTHSLTAFGAVALPAPGKLQHFQTALWVLGGVYLGLDLPIAAQTQIENHQVWDVTSGPDSTPGGWGGHATACVGFDAQGVIIVTWGQVQRATWAWMAEYCQEVWGLVSSDFLKSGVSPQGFNLAALEADLAAVRS